MIDRRPAVIARCTSTADVTAVINHGREQGMPISVHGGGHNVSGHAVCDDGVMVDLRPMKKIDIDVERKERERSGRADLGDFDAATQEHGLAVTGGRMSTTGIAGFTLGSGSGWIERKHGLAADNLLSAEVVLAGGSVQTASEVENPDRFWALRGGGGTSAWLPSSSSGSTRSGRSCSAACSRTRASAPGRCCASSGSSWRKRPTFPGEGR